jgi:hypothetical protein
LASKCPECGQERLLSAFDSYSEDDYGRCRACVLTSRILAPLIYSLFFRLQVNDSAVTRLLKDPLTRRCMLSVVKGIANFGIRYPQPTGAPITVVWNFTNRCNLK